MKILKVVLILLLVVVIVGGVAAAILVPKLKPTLEEELSTALSSEVTVSDVRWIPMTGARIDGFSARLPAATSAWLKVSSVEAQVALWSLIFRQGMVADIVVKTPEITVERIDATQWNLPTFEEKPDQKQESPVLPTHLVVQDGSFSYKDAYAQPPVGPWDLVGLQADLRLTSALAYRYTASGYLRGPSGKTSGKIRAEGETTLKQVTQATIDIADLDIQEVGQYVKEAIDVAPTAGMLNATVRIDGTPEQMTARVQLEVRGLQFPAEVMTRYNVSAQSLVQSLQDKDGRIRLEFTAMMQNGQWQVNLDDLISSMIQQAIQSRLGNAVQQAISEGISKLFEAPIEGQEQVSTEDRFKELGKQFKKSLKEQLAPEPTPSEQSPPKQ